MLEIENLEKKLDLLHSKNWHQPIHIILDNFSEYPFAQIDHSPDIEINKILVDLIEQKKGVRELTSLDHIFANQLSKIECFSYRALLPLDEELLIWNPLVESFVDFKARLKHNPKTYQVDKAYPAEDIVNHWFIHITQIELALFAKQHRDSAQ